MVTLEQTMRIQAPVARCFDLARSVEVHVAGNVHWGESAMATGGVTSGLIGPGQHVTWRARHFGIRFTLTSEITAFDRPAHFQDVMVSGPFGMMRHDHYFTPLPGAATAMRDVFCFSAPLGLLGRLVEVLVLRRYMSALLEERNRVIREIAESGEWRRYLPDAEDVR